jgi:holo-[acyl-carrier protein] synthase
MRSRVSIGGDAASSILVGTDLIEVARIAESIQRFGDRYLRRVYTSNERKYCMSAGGDAAPYFAARFAAKEAVIKVLRPTRSDALTWRSIEVVRSEEGWCTVHLRGTARTLARRARLAAFAVSLSHEERYATASVVAERTLPRLTRAPRSRPKAPRTVA